MFVCVCVCYTCQSVARGNRMYRNSCSGLSSCIWRLILLRIEPTGLIITNQRFLGSKWSKRKKKARKEGTRWAKVWAGERMNLERCLRKLWNFLFFLVMIKGPFIFLIVKRVLWLSEAPLCSCIYSRVRLWIVKTKKKGWPSWNHFGWKQSIKNCSSFLQKFSDTTRLVWGFFLNHW